MKDMYDDCIINVTMLHKLLARTLKYMTQRKTQQQRRDESYAVVLKSACELFGKKGYADTSLQEIAKRSGLTIRPIYHYFGNKKQLFLAVTEQFENLLAQALEARFTKDHSANLYEGWQAFKEMTENEAFRRIVLEDAPNILGRERWSECAAVIKIKAHFFPQEKNVKSEFILRMLIAALAEAAIMRSENKDIDAYIEELIQNFSQTGWQGRDS